MGSFTLACASAERVRSVAAGVSLCRKPLQFEDMWRLPPQDRVANLAQRFETVWEKEQQKAKPSLVRHSHLPCSLISIPVCWTPPVWGIVTGLIKDVWHAYLYQ